LHVSERFSLIDLSRKEMGEERTAWRTYVFEPLETNILSINSYLDELFSTNGANKDVQIAYCLLCESTRQFQEQWDKYKHFDRDLLQWAIDGVLGSDLLIDEKRAQIKDIA